MASGIKLLTKSESKPKEFRAVRWKKKWYADPAAMLIELGLYNQSKNEVYPQFVYANGADLVRQSTALYELARLEFNSDKIAKSAAGMEYLNFSPANSDLYIPPVQWLWIDVPAARKEGINI